MLHADNRWKFGAINGIASLADSTFLIPCVGALLVTCRLNLVAVPMLLFTCVDDQS